MGEIEPLLSSTQVAEIVGVPRKTLTKWAGSGYGPPSFRVGRYRRYRRADVEAWLAEQAKRGERGGTGRGPR